MKFNPGEIVKINPQKSYSPENLLLLHLEPFGEIKLHETIDISSYPSYNDFKGYINFFKEEHFVIVELKGRPLSFSVENKWELYDVYKIMYNNRIYECFSYCLEKINEIP